MSHYFFAILIVFFSASSQARERGTTEQEFEIKKEYLKKRYQDFFIRETEADRRERTRLEAAAEQKAARQAVRDQYEKTRKEFVANRKAKPVLSDEVYKRETEEQRRQHEQSRKEYTKRRDNLSRIEASTGVIPDWIEYKLYEPYETSDSLE